MAVDKALAARLPQLENVNFRGGAAADSGRSLDNRLYIPALFGRTALQKRVPFVVQKIPIPAKRLPHPAKALFKRWIQLFELRNDFQTD